MAELTPWTEVSASWMSVWGDEDDISIKNEDFDVQNGTNNGGITFDIDTDLMHASASIDKESDTCASTNATFVDICHGLDLGSIDAGVHIDVDHSSLHLSDHHNSISNVIQEDIVHTTPSTSTTAGVDHQEHLIAGLNDHHEIKVMTEQELATEYLMNSVSLMKTSKHQLNDGLIMDMPLDAMYANGDSTDVDQLIDEKLDINANDLIMGVDLDESQDINQLIGNNGAIGGQPCHTGDGNNRASLSDGFKNRLHYVKYINRDGKHVKIWECGVCKSKQNANPSNKEFGHQYTLMRHLPTHTDERKFQCNTCGKAFRQMSTLSQHRAIHSADRPYVCELCRKTFNRVSTLISHRKTHSGLKPHQCHLCHKAFHQKGNLRNHIFTHTNERPYKCDVCQKGFNQMSNLMCHKLKAHQRNDKPKYMCRLCNKEFPKRMALRNHEEYKHGIKTQTQTNNNNHNNTNTNTQLNNNNSGNNELLLQPSTIGGPMQMTNQLLMNTSNVNNGADVMQTHLQLHNTAIGESHGTVAGADKMRIIHIPDMGGVGAGNGGVTVQPAPQASTKVRYTNGVLVDAINTEAMRQALQAQQENGTSSLPSSAPFALLRPIGGIPVLVRVLSAPHGKHMLVPATAEDLKAHGKVTISDASGSGINFNGSTDDPSKNSNTTTTVQIKIPVVATVVQKFEADGTMSMSVESPGPDNRQLIQDSINNAVDSHRINNFHNNNDSNMEFLKESCDTMSISLQNSSGYMNFNTTLDHSSSSNGYASLNDIDNPASTSSIEIKDNTSFDSIDLCGDEHSTASLAQQHHDATVSSTTNDSNNYADYHTNHHLYTSSLNADQFNTFQIIEAHHQTDTSEQQQLQYHNNVLTNCHEDDDTDDIILDEDSLYNEVNNYTLYNTINDKHEITDDASDNAIVSVTDNDYTILE